MRAKGVLGYPGAESVGRQRILAAQQFKILWRHRQMKDALLCADSAAALRQQIQIDLHAKANSAAMTAAFTVF